MPTESAYQEKWLGVVAVTESDLGAEVTSQAEALAKIDELQMGMMPALDVGSEAAKRDWRKVCDLELSLKREFAAEAAPKRPPPPEEQLAAHVHACCVDTAFKLYKEGGPEWTQAMEIAQRPEVKAIRGSKAFREHHRCEPNYELDSAELAALERATDQPDLVRMKIGLAKAVFVPRDGTAMQISNFSIVVSLGTLWKSHATIPEA